MRKRRKRRRRRREEEEEEKHMKTLNTRFVNGCLLSAVHLHADSVKRSLDGLMESRARHPSTAASTNKCETLMAVG